jgi:hypothetical protein
MKVECKDRERILRGAEPEAMAALDAHARDCAACREELALWREISAAAPLLRKEWDSPELWPRIRQALAEQAAARPAGRVAAMWQWWAESWKPALAAAALLALSATLIWRALDTERGPSPLSPEAQRQEQRLLTEQALEEIQKSEAAYEQAIGKLERLAAAGAAQPETPLSASYREKLLVLDAAIAELKAQAERNRFHAHLRQELLSLYKEKKTTLELLARGDSDAR